MNGDGAPAIAPETTMTVLYGTMYDEKIRKLVASFLDDAMIVGEGVEVRLTGERREQALERMTRGVLVALEDELAAIADRLIEARQRRFAVHGAVPRAVSR